MVWRRCTTGTKARQSVNMRGLIVIGEAFGIGRAMDVSGAAREVAHIFFSAIGPISPRMLLFVLSLLTAVISQLVTNKGAAILMFPIAMELAAQGEVPLSPVPFVMTLMATAASSYMTPIGIVPNLMVYGPGGYKFTDYLRMGVPLTLMIAILCALLTPLAFPFLP